MKKKEAYQTVKVYSSINDKNIKKDVDGSPIWEKAHHLDELKDVPKGKEMFEYTMKFDGTKPVFVTNVKKLSKW